jgi:hypothetical protein
VLVPLPKYDQQLVADTWLTATVAASHHYDDDDDDDDHHHHHHHALCIEGFVVRPPARSCIH